MALVDAVAALVCWWMRRWPIVAVAVQAVLISAGVAIFPLHFGGGLPIVLSFVSVLASQLILLVGGYYLVWRKAGPILFRGTR